jgi:hypothetical protein
MTIVEFPHHKHLSKRDNEILSLMRTLDIEQFCISTQIVQDGPRGRDMLDRELMIKVDSKHGAASFLAVQEFTWGENFKHVQRLMELLGLKR